MENKSLNSIPIYEITDKDIDWVENILFTRSVHFQDSQRRVIKNLTSKEIQACPGSGKTTVLLAKLLILGRKYNSTVSGICVLSYTNAAKDELINKIGNSSIGRSILAPPNFIGTIQSFSDKFMTIPFLRNHKIRMNNIGDNEILLDRYSSLGYNFALSKRRNPENYFQYSKEWGKIEITKCGEQTSTYKRIISCINKSIKNGNLTYTEMQLLANELLDDSNLSSLISKKFPYVFIDENQDTDGLDYSIISKCFEKSLIFQKLGDPNQQIFNSTKGFPSINIGKGVKTDYLSESLRFTNDIANLAKPFAHYAIPEFIGLKKLTKKYNNTIFLFNDDNIGKVKDAYAQLILDSFSNEELNQNKCWAISQRIEKADETKTSPQKGRCLSDYFPSFSREIADLKESSSLIVCTLKARETLKKNHSFSSVNSIVKGLKKALIKCKSPHLSDSFNRSTNYRTFMKLFTNDEEYQLYTILYKLLNEKITFSSAISLLLTIFPELKDSEFINQDFVPFDIKENPNIFLYESNDLKRNVSINLGSIHSVKGQTHLATLIVDSFNYNYCISETIKKISIKKTLGDRDINRLHCIFVGLTRPQNLVCLAINEENISEFEIQWLKKNSWEIQYLKSVK